MLKIRENIKIYLYTDYVDFRKAINGLASIIIDNKIDNPSSGNLVTFHNKGKDKIKILFWDRNGFVL